MPRTLLAAAAFTLALAPALHAQSNLGWAESPSASEAGQRW